MRGGGDSAETDLDNVFYTTGQAGGGKRRRKQTKRRTVSRRKMGGSDQPDTDFDSIFGQEVRFTAGGSKKRASRRGARKGSKRQKKSRQFRHSRKHKSMRGGHSWSNVGVDRVRRSLQSGRVVETGRLKDYNIYKGAY